MIILIADKPGAALDHVAQGIASGLDEPARILYSSRVGSPKELSIEILSADATRVHFLWRGDILRWIMGDRQSWLAVSGLCSVTTSIPDFAYLSPADFEPFRRVFQEVDGYTVANSQLLRIYSRITGIPSPLGILHDPLPDVASLRLRIPAESRQDVIWVGNSRWGEWLPSRDYKGYQSIIRPAVEKLRRHGVDVSLTTIDSSKTTLERSHVLRAIARSRILLSASCAEGTGLPVLEGMSLGVPVVSTKTGLVCDIAGPLQSELLCRRNPHDFADRIRMLIDNRDYWQAVADENLESIAALKSSELNMTWQAFLGSEAQWKADIRQPAPAIRSHGGIAQSGLRRVVGTAKRSRVLRTGAQAASSKWHWAHSGLARVAAWTRSTGRGQWVDIWIEGRCEQGSRNPVIAAFNPDFVGVSRSTESIFSDAMPFPEDTFDVPSPILRSWADRLLSTGVKVVVLSGGDAAQLRFAKHVAGAGIQIWIAWHGTPSQFVDPNHKDNFRRVINCLEAGYASRILVFNSDVLQYARWLQLPADEIQNTIPFEFRRIDAQRVTGSRFRSAGLWAAGITSGKNLPTQLMAALQVGLEANVTSMGRTLADLIPAHENVRINTWPLVRDAFALAGMLESVDVVLSVSHHEAAPMTTLEALGVGTPFLAGPTILKHAAYGPLATLVTVSEPDSTSAIRQRILNLEASQETFALTRLDVARHIIETSIEVNSRILGEENVRI